MAGPAILDADMATLARWARGALDWWLQELRGLVPESLRRRLSGFRGPALMAHFDGGQLRLTRRGVTVARGGGRPAVALAVAAGTILVREVALPRLGPGDLERLIAFDADRLLPFAAGTALVAHEVGRPLAGGTQLVALAALPIDAASAAMAAASAEGLDVRQLGAAARDKAGDRVRFDFLPAWRRVGAASAPDGGPVWWGLVGLMFVVNLGVLIGRDIYNLRETAALVEAHGQTAAIARTLRARVIAEDARRRQLLIEREARDPLPILAAVTRALPDAAWVQRLGWDGAQLRLAGYSAGGVDVIGLLRRSPTFVAVRSTASEMPAPSSVLQPFEATADTPAQAGTVAAGGALPSGGAALPTGAAALQ